MRLLLSAILLSFACVVQAQTTNLSYVLTVAEGTTRTNQFTNSIAALAVTGVHVAYMSYLNASTNNLDNFRQFARTYFKALSEEPLKNIGKDYELSQAKVDKITASILLNWENATAADRKLLTDWLTKYPVN